jgi:hypothetical protein
MGAHHFFARLEQRTQLPSIRRIPYCAAMQNYDSPFADSFMSMTIIRCNTITVRGTVLLATIILPIQLNMLDALSEEPSEMRTLPSIANMNRHIVRAKVL